MDKGKGAWLFGYGVFLFVCGAAAYLVNPNQAPTPLIAGAIGGGIASMLGVMIWKGGKWAFSAGTMLTIIFMMLGLAMAMQHWMMVKSGKPEMTSALIDTLVVVGSGWALWALKRKG